VFLQCFDTVGWVTGRTSSTKNVSHIPNKNSKKIEGKWLTWKKGGH